MGKVRSVVSSVVTGVFWVMAAAMAATPLVLDSAVRPDPGPAAANAAEPEGEETAPPGPDGIDPDVGPAQPSDHAVRAGGLRERPHGARAEAWLDGTPARYSPIATSVLPGEELRIDVAPDEEDERLVRMDGREDAGEVEVVDEDAWIWTAPDEPGFHRLRVLEDGGNVDLVVHAFVTVPESEIEDGVLNGYRIGSYPRVPLRGDTMYIRPRGFIEVTEENRDLRVSPRFLLKHFETKQGGGFPRYVVLQRRLLTKLELLVDALVERGHPVTSLHVMSGYRTPSYNQAIGNTTSYSRHAWGDAADVFVDEDGDNLMDDLNGDGRIDRSDARILYEVVDSLDRDPDTRHLMGGASIYGANAVHGPFVHVDTRGTLVRW